jgi:hypothetical protein
MAKKPGREALRMTITFPLARADFGDLLPISQAKIWLDPQQEISGDGTGTYYATDLTDKIWRGELTLDDALTHEDADDIEAQIDTLNGSMFSFIMADPRRLWPCNDAGGTTIKAWATPVTIADVDNNNRLKLAGLPPHYKLARGDRFHLTFGSNPLHRGYYRIAVPTPDTADVEGNSGWLDFRPLFPDNAVDIGTVVTLYKAAAEWIIAPKGRTPGTGRRTITPGGTLSIQQVF